MPTAHTPARARIPSIARAATPEPRRVLGGTRDCRMPVARGATWRSGRSELRETPAEGAVRRRGNKSSLALLRPFLVEHVGPSHGGIRGDLDRFGLCLEAGALYSDGVPTGGYGLFDHRNGPHVAAIDEKRTRRIGIHRDEALRRHRSGGRRRRWRGAAPRLRGRLCHDPNGLD